MKTKYENETEIFDEFVAKTDPNARSRFIFWSDGAYRTSVFRPARGNCFRLEEIGIAFYCWLRTNCGFDGSRIALNDAREKFPKFLSASLCEYRARTACGASAVAGGRLDG